MTRSGRLAAALVIVATSIVLAGVATWLLVGAAEKRTEADRIASDANRLAIEEQQLTENVDTDNIALTDAERTSAATKYVTSAIEAAFSYNYTDLAATERAVAEHLTGKARCVYDQLYGEVKRLAPEQKLVLVTKVREIAVSRLDSDGAEALVYFDQTSTRVDTNKSAVAGGQFAVTAQRQGDKWKLTGIDLLDQPLANGDPAPTC